MASQGTFTTGGLNNGLHRSCAQAARQPSDGPCVGRWYRQKPAQWSGVPSSEARTRSAAAAGPDPPPAAPHALLPAGPAPSAWCHTCEAARTTSGPALPTAAYAKHCVMGPHSIPSASSGCSSRNTFMCVCPCPAPYSNH